MIVNVAETVDFADRLGMTLAPDGARVPVERIVHRWTITIDTAPRFLMIVNECPCALRRHVGTVYLLGDAGPWSRGEVDYERYTDKTNCTCPYNYGKCARGFTGDRMFHACHGWHRPKVDAAVKKIYAGAKPTSLRSALTAALKTVGSPRDLDVRGLPSREQLAELKAFETLVTVT